MVAFINLEDCFLMFLAKRVGLSGKFDSFLINVFDENSDYQEEARGKIKY